MEDVKFKTFPVRMTLQLNNKLREVSFRQDVTMHDFVMKAIKEKLEREAV